MFCGSGKAAGTDRFAAEFPMPDTGASASVRILRKSDTKREPHARDVPGERPAEPEGRRGRVAGRGSRPSNQGTLAEGGREGEGGGPQGSSVEVPARDGSPGAETDPRGPRPAEVAVPCHWPEAAGDSMTPAHHHRPSKKHLSNQKGDLCRVPARLPQNSISS